MTVRVVRKPAPGEVDLTRPLPRTLYRQPAFSSFLFALATLKRFTLGTTHPACSFCSYVAGMAGGGGGA